MMGHGPIDLLEFPLAQSAQLYVSVDQYNTKQSFHIDDDF